MILKLETKRVLGNRRAKFRAYVLSFMKRILIVSVVNKSNKKHEFCVEQTSI
jgi:hypothetical protein